MVEKLIKEEEVVDWFRIVSTSHVAKESIIKIKKVYESFQPDAIAIELDKQRLHSLLSEAKEDYSIRLIRQTGVMGYLFLLLGRYVQKKLGNIVNTKPGADMKAGVELAVSNKKPLLLVDQPINITMKKLNKALGFKFVWSLIKDFFQSLFPKRRKELKKKLSKLDLNKIPKEKLVLELVEEMKEKYPGLYRVLLEDRNKVISKNLKKYHELNPDKKVLVILGAAHARGIKELLSKN